MLRVEKFTSMKSAAVLLVLVIVLFNGGKGENLKIHPRFRRSVVKDIDIYTLDHFIGLVEKIERHQLAKNKPLKVIANYIRKLSYNGDKWTTLLGKQSDSLPDGILTPQEKAILTNMVNHRFLGQQEQGVVHTPFGDVAMGRVITGICAGVSRNKNLILSQIQSITTNHIDNLYAATIAGDLGLASLANKKNPSLPLLGPGGTWSPNTQCPQTFNADIPTPSKATNAQIIGGIDGFLLGNMLPGWIKRGVRLGQLLRMYYQNGVVYNKYYAACKRLRIFNAIVMESQLTTQVTLAAYAIKAVWNNGVDYSSVSNSEIPGISKTTVQKFYTHIENLPGYKCPDGNDEGCSLPANMVFVLDESGSITQPNYEVEKNFVKKIIEAFEISPYQTRVAAVEYSDDATESIKLGEYYSKSTLMCAVDRLHYTSGFTFTSKALKVAYDVLEKAQAQAGSDHANDPQIMILLTDGQSNRGKRVLRPIVESIRKNITGITMVAVGVGNYVQSELELIATDPIKHVLTTTDFDKLVTLVKELRKQTCETATLLDSGRNLLEKTSEDGKGNEVQTSGYVSPGKARFFKLTPESLHKVENISIEVTPSYGTLTVYASRTNASPGPDNYDFKFNVDNAILRQRRSTDTTKGKRIEFYNVCKGYNKTTCPPLYISVYGENSTNSCSDLDCSLPSEIKFTIKTAQISKTTKKDTVCYFKVPADNLTDAAEVSISIRAPNNSITLFTSRSDQKPDENTYDEMLSAKEDGKTKVISIKTPCAAPSTCHPIYMSLKGESVKCSCFNETECAVPNEVTIKVKPKDPIHLPTEIPQYKEVKCFYKVPSEKLLGAAGVAIKISSNISSPLEIYLTRKYDRRDSSNITDKLSTSAGNGTVINVRNPCSGYDTCPPLYLTIIGPKISCNCTTDLVGKKEQCSLPEDVTITLTKGQTKSSANTVKKAILVTIVGVFLCFAAP